MSEAASENSSGDYYWRDPFPLSPQPQREPAGWQYRFKAPASGQWGPWRNMAGGEDKDFYDLYPDCFETRPLYAEQGNAANAQMLAAAAHKTIAGATRYAENLAVSLSYRWYPEATEWVPRRGDLQGLLEQIDNMTSGAVRLREPDRKYGMLPEFDRGWKQALSAANSLLTMQSDRAQEEAGNERNGELDRCLLSTRGNVLRSAANDLQRLKGGRP